MSSKSVQIIGGNDRDVVHVDPVHNAMTRIEERHKKTHDGGIFSVSMFTDAVAKDAIVPLGIEIPANFEAHVLFTVSVSAAMILRVYEDRILVGAQDHTEALNRKRSIVGSQGTSAKFPITSGGEVGTLLQTMFLPGGFTVAALGFLWEPKQEWICSPETNFILEFENISGQKDQIVSALFDLHLEPA